MKNHLLAERYARALCESLDTGELEQAAAALTDVAGVFASEHDLRSALSNPSLAIDRRRQVLEQVLARMDIPAKVAGLLQVMLRRGRIALLPDVAHCFEQQMDRRLGRAGAVAVTALTLPDEARTVLRDSLARFSGKDVRLTFEVDPAIVGGVVVRLEGLLLDGSMRTRLRRLAQSLLSGDIEVGQA